VETELFVPSDQPLIERAREAIEHAYAPYSRFRVGAAVSTAEGRVYVGTNVENASYGLTICAERVAIFSAIAAGARELAVLALCTEPAPAKAAETMPCGACRQVMAEFMQEDARILVDGVGSFELQALLPLAFRLKPNR
jgi:cytidine deaminase